MRKRESGRSEERGGEADQGKQLPTNKAVKV